MLALRESASCMDPHGNLDGGVEEVHVRVSRLNCARYCIAFDKACFLHVIHVGCAPSG